MTITPRWHGTGHPHFPLAARVDEQWWVLRLNSFPDHPLWTLFIDGRARYDIDDAPPAWGPLPAAAPALDAGDARDALAPVADLIAYGSEAGHPCDNPYCCG
jgi:hypothetical protein